MVSNILKNRLAQTMADLDPRMRIVQEYMDSHAIDWTDPETAIATITTDLIDRKKMLEEQKEALAHRSSTDDTIPQFRECHVDLTKTEDFLLKGGDPSTCYRTDELSLKERSRLWKWQALVHAHQASKQWGLMINRDDTTVIDTFPHIMKTSIRAPEFDAMLAQAATEIKNNLRNPQTDYHSQKPNPRTEDIFYYTQVLLDKIFVETQDAPDVVLQEKNAWKETLGKEVEVPRLPAEVTPQVQKNLNDLGLKLRYIPQLNIGTLGELKRMGEEMFLNKIQERYPNWRKTLSREEVNDHRIGRNLKKWFWRGAKQGRVSFPQLPGTWVAVETMPKPSYRVPYVNTPVTDALGFEDRFNVSWNDAQRAIENNKNKLLAEIGLLSSADVRMLTAIEWNLLANREGWGSTNTFEFTKTVVRNREYLRLVIGDSESGGAADFACCDPADSFNNVGFRVAVVLGT
jgi:hypothetical protein